MDFDYLTDAYYAAKFDDDNDVIQVEDNWLFDDLD
jgi:hypothetical protein